MILKLVKQKFKIVKIKSQNSLYRLYKVQSAIILRHESLGTTKLKPPKEVIKGKSIWQMLGHLVWSAYKTTLTFLGG